VAEVGPAAAAASDEGLSASFSRPRSFHVVPSRKATQLQVLRPSLPLPTIGAGGSSRPPDVHGAFGIFGEGHAVANCVDGRAASLEMTRTTRLHFFCTNWPRPCHCIVATPHDSLFHRTFADPAHAAALLRLALPPELVAAIDWETLRVLPNQITDADLKKHFPDHVYSARLLHHDLTLVFVPEHKSGPDSGYVLQELDYVQAVLEQWAEQDPAGDGGLPPVIPVLFHHGNEPWHMPTSLLHLFDRAGLGAVRQKDPALAAIIESVSVSLPSRVVDMAPVDEDWLRKTDLPDVVKLMMLCIRVARFQDKAEVAATLERWHDLLVAVHKAPMGSGKLGGIESYLVQIDKLDYDQLSDIVQRTTGTGDRLMSIAERLRKEGEARGKAEGKAEGEATGRTQQAVETVLRLLTRRFGEPGESVARRVRGASLVELDRWTERVLDARTLDDVFAAG